MRTAKEWLKVMFDTEVTKHTFEEHIQQIQLDAYKAGMTEGANIAMRYPRSETVVAQDIQAARNNKTAV